MSEHTKDKLHIDDSAKQALIKLISDSTLDVGMLLSQVTELQNNNKYLKKHKNAIWQDKSGKYTTHLPAEGGRKKISSLTKDGLNKKIIAFYKGIDDAPTFGCIFNEWLDEKLKTDISKGTYDRYKTDFYRFFDDDFRSSKMHDLSESQIICYIKRVIKAQELSYKAYSGMRTIIMGVLKYAKSKGYSNLSATSLFDSFELNKRSFRKTVKPDESQIYTEEDLFKLVNYLEKDTDNVDYALASLFLIRTGLRIGELGAVKKEDVTDNSIIIRRQYISFKGDKGHRIYKTVDYTKSSAGLRNVILTDKTKEIIAKTCARHPDNEFLFLCQGRQLTSSVINNYLRNVCKIIGINYRSVHKIRKTFATTLLNSGVDEAYVKSVMGHEDINTTRSHYYTSKRKKDYENQIKSAIVI